MGTIYVVVGNDKTAKIGSSQDAESLPDRLKDAKKRYALQGQKCHVHSIIRGNKSDERGIHDRFDALRIPMPDDSIETYKVADDLQRWLSWLGRSPFAARSIESLYVTETGCSDDEIFPFSRPWTQLDVATTALGFPTTHPDLSFHPLSEEESENFWRAQDKNEWYTPKEYVALCRSVLGTIDLDPASGPLPQLTVRATKYFNKHQKGELQPWYLEPGIPANILCNPPYSGEQVAFIEHGVMEYKKGNAASMIFILNANSINSKWFQVPMRTCTAYCTTADRISFDCTKPRKHPENERSKNNTVFFYFGNKPQLFREVFDPQVGAVMPGIELAWGVK